MLDKTYQFDDLKVFVDQASLLYLDGAEVDYVESLEGSGFKFNNPNVKSTCGCGSFLQRLSLFRATGLPSNKNEERPERGALSVLRAILRAAFVRKRKTGRLSPARESYNPEDLRRLRLRAAASEESEAQEPEARQRQRDRFRDRGLSDSEVSKLSWPAPP